MALQTLYDNSAFMQQLGKVPVIESSVNTVSSVYNKSKEYVIFRVPLTVAEAGAKLAVSTVQVAAKPAMPLVEKLTPTLKDLDSKAETKLQEVITNYPVLQKTPQELCDVGKEYTHSKISQLRKYKDDQVTWAFNKSTEALDLAMNNPPGRLLSKYLDSSLTNLEDFVNKKLPKVEGEIKAERPATYAVQRFYHLGQTARARMYHKALEDLQKAQETGKQMLSNVEETIQLVERVQVAKEKWQEFISTSNENPETVQERLVESTRSIARLLNDTATNLANFTMKFHPSNASQTMEESAKYAHELLEAVKKAPVTALEIPSWTLQKLRDAATHLASLPSTFIHSLLQELAVTKRKPEEDLAEQTSHVDDKTSAPSDESKAVDEGHNTEAKLLDSELEEDPEKKGQPESDPVKEPNSADQVPDTDINLPDSGVEDLPESDVPNKSTVEEEEEVISESSYREEADLAE